MSRLRDGASTVHRYASRLASSVRTQYSSLALLRDRRLGILAAATVLDTMSATIFVPLLPSLAEKLGASAFVIGLIFTVPAVVGVVVSAPAGYLSDRWGRRPIIAFGVTLSALPVIAIGFAWSPLVLIVLRGLDALLRAFVNPATHAYLGDAYAEDERASAFGAYQTMTMLGAAVGPVAGGAIATYGGLSLPFVVLGLGTLAGGLVLVAFLPPAVEPSDGTGENATEEVPDGGDGVESDEEDEKKGGGAAMEADGEAMETEEAPASAADDSGLLPSISRESVGVFLTVPAVAWLVVAFINEFGTNALNPIFPLLLRETVGGGPAYAGTTYSALAVAMLVFLPVGGRVADRIGRARSMTVVNLGWAVVLVGLAVASSPLVPPLLMFLGGMLSALAAPAASALRYEIAPDGREATFSGITGAMSSAGKAAGPMFAGVSVGLWGVRATAVLAGAAWLASIPLLVLFVPNEPGSKAAAEAED